MDSVPGWTGILTILCVSFLLFLIARELMCWYWKINQALVLLQQAVAQLKDMNSKLDAAAARPVQGGGIAPPPVA